jgi:MGT family glycosyltransferase
MRVLFLSAQLPGHLDWGGYLATARALMERGHEILWASGNEVLPLVEREGVPAIALKSTGWRWPPPPPIRPQAGTDRQQFARLRMQRALDQWLDVGRVTEATIELSALVHEFQPDLILSEMFVATAGLVAEQHDIPFAVIGWPAPEENMALRGREAQQTVVAEARERLDKLLTHFDLQGVNWTQSGIPAQHSPHLHLTYWSESWLGVPATPPTRHVGGIGSPTEHAQPQSPGLKELVDPLILITLGTSFNDDPDFFAAAAYATDQMGAVPLIALGKALSSPGVTALRDRLPSRTQIYEIVDLPAVLPLVSAAIHHGGAGTTHALVTHGVPQIVVPHAADQQQQAQGAARSGVGFHIASKQARPDNLSSALSLLLPDRSDYRTQAEHLRQEFSELGGVPRAADIIEQLLQRLSER